ncbi:MAG: hypothetical protein D3926_08290 [Desulfobacteraceae bacterium]|nr:MAG: hypothetical protein D3926_08290 [Desulfobacteraceae bacterium]
MIQTNKTIHALPTFNMLTPDQIEELTAAAFIILEKTGIKVLHDGARQMLVAAGSRMNGDIVKVPEYIVRDCLLSSPKGWTIYDRNGKSALDLRGRNSYYGTSTASPNTKDALTGEYHKTGVEDLKRAAHIADALDNIDWVMPMGSAQDVPAIAAELHEFAATVPHTTKPIVFLSYSPRGMELVYDMAEAVAGGRDQLREKPFLVSYPEPITPLVMPEETVDRIFVSADRFLPQMMGPCVQFGATGPVTIPAGVAQGVAESMMCIVLAQLRSPGCPVGLGCTYAAFDMMRGLLSVGGPEMSLAQAAHAEVAQSLGLPTWGLAGATDSKMLDAQAGVEATFHIMAQGMSGLNLIHDVGYMDMTMACSVEQLILGDEIIGMVRRFMRGLEFNPEQIALDLIDKVGPGGQFLSEKHTLTHFKKELWQPKIFTRKPFEKWDSDGRRSTEDRVREKIVEILDTHKPEPLPDSTIEKIEHIKTEGEKELTNSSGS